MEIPGYTAMGQLALGDKQLLDRLFQQLQPRISEMTFAGLYLFRRGHDYRLARVGESLAGLGTGYDRRRYCLPPLGGDIASALDMLFAQGVELYGADDESVARHPERRLTVGDA